MYIYIKMYIHTYIYVHIYTHMNINRLIFKFTLYSYGPPHMAVQKQDNQCEHTYSSYVRIWDVALTTCRRR